MKGTLQTHQLIAIFFSMLLAKTLFMSAKAYAEPSKIYLVRHAEKVTTVRDGDLTKQGQQRAKNVAHMLKSAGINAIYSTDYKRTQQTAAPLAKTLNLKVQSYNPRELKAFAENLKQQSGVIMVVGHSNTTPYLVRLLGGKAKDMTEKEYTRLYQLSFDNQNVSTVLLHTSANK